MRVLTAGRPARRSLPVLPRFSALMIALVLVGCGSQSTPSPVAVISPSPHETTAIATPRPTPAPGTPAPTEVVATAAPTARPTLEPGPDRWVAAGRMRPLVSQARAVELDNGRVLAVGSGNKGPVSGIWDPATNRWRRAESLNKDRYGFALLALPDGRALVAGGLNGAAQSFSSAYAFDPATERWSKVGVMDNARTEAAAAVMADGRVLMAGGNYCTGYRAAADVVLAAHDPQSGLAGWAGPILADAEPPPNCRALATAEVFDPRTGGWTPTGAMRRARAAAVAAPLGDGRVLVWETFSLHGVYRDDLGEIYDPATGRFTAAPALPELDRAYFEGRGVTVPAGQSPEAGEWDLQSVALVALAGGDALLILEGWLYGTWDEVGITRVLRFDTKGNAWADIGELSMYVADGDQVTRYGDRHPGGLVAPTPDGRVLFAGGEKTPRNAELLDPDDRTWSPLPMMPEERREAQAVALADGSVLVLGDRVFRFVPAR